MPYSIIKRFLTLLLVVLLCAIGAPTTANPVTGGGNVPIQSLMEEECGTMARMQRPSAIRQIIRHKAQVHHFLPVTQKPFVLNPAGVSNAVAHIASPAYPGLHARRGPPVS